MPKLAESPTLAEGTSNTIYSTFHHESFVVSNHHVTAVPNLEGGGYSSGASVPKFLSLPDLRRAERVIEIRADGNCLFRCIATAYYGSSQRHSDVRSEIASFCEEMGEEYSFKSGYFDSEWTLMLTTKTKGLEATGTFGGYVRYLKTKNTYGDTACFRMFKELHPEFEYAVWGEARQDIVFTPQFDSMFRCVKINWITRVY